MYTKRYHIHIEGEIFFLLFPFYHHNPINYIDKNERRDERKIKRKY